MTYAVGSRKDAIAVCRVLNRNAAGPRQFWMPARYPNGSDFEERWPWGVVRRWKYPEGSNAGEAWFGGAFTWKARQLAERISRERRLVDVKYYVIDENKLCYLNALYPHQLGLLAAEPDSAWRPEDGPYYVPSDKSRMRPATIEDFERFTNDAFGDIRNVRKYNTALVMTEIKSGMEVPI